MPRAITTIVDDTDSRFAYEGSWARHQNDHEYGHSSHLTHGSGTATLKFRGTSIAVYGTLASDQESQGDPVPPISLYTLENGFSTQYHGHPTTQSQYRSEFFRMDNLPYGDHVLVVKNTAEKDMFLLDYVEIGVSDSCL
ncbi:hypothetical protein BJ165DRAFT_632810 [Panaeolus papilionaceus]|nr:hypothetical protein BJ165DRAFT_632810 [Panaeolus papilionaceus]